jgi:SM-20-related protein
MIQNLEQKYELLINGIIENEFGLCDDFIDQSFSAELKNLLLKKYQSGLFKSASIGKGDKNQHNTEIRSDSILWIDNLSEHPVEKTLIRLIDDFINHLNQTCFTGLNSFEIHYALYPEGSFYKKHLDSFHLDKRRFYSFILYLNEDWTQENGGQLKIYPKNNEVVEILPISGRAVFFPSQSLFHEVLPSNKSRMSITGWFRK